jgi:hypothetical protein
MAKFKAGDMIISKTEERISVLMVNRVFTEENQYSFNKGQEMYSLDNGSGFSDARERVETIDSEYTLIDN